MDFSENIYTPIIAMLQRFQSSNQSEKMVKYIPFFSPGSRQIAMHF